MIKRVPLTLIALVTLLVVSGLVAFAVLSRRQVTDSGALTVYANAQRSVMQPVLDLYTRKHPGLGLHYVDLNGEELYGHVTHDVDSGRRGADVLISTAMDLQVKLVNDGYAQPFDSSSSHALPPWARWRNEAFAVSFEPVVMVYNTKVMAGRALPRSRIELAEAIHDDPAFWRGKIGLSDPRRPSIAYLLTSQESREASDFGALMKAFGTAEVQPQESSGTILQQVSAGSLALAYNVLESNARRLLNTGAPLHIVYPYDFTLALLRVAVIPRNAANPPAAKAFLDLLLSPEGQEALRRGGLTPINSHAAAHEALTSPFPVFHPVPLGPNLLVYLDATKRRRLMANWQSLVNVAPEPAPSAVKP